MGMDAWLALAPPPPPLQKDRTWHVFLSYRSTDRKWALALYDILTQLQYRVFMDQFVLVAGDGLAMSLGENLAASQAGILVWSTRSDDSAWCKKEYNAFEARNAAGNFPYVVVRLPHARIPELTGGGLWIEAGDEHDGPRGTSLLRLLYGLHGQPLPAEAVRLAASIDDATRRDLACIANHARDRAADAILRLADARNGDLAWQSSPLLACAAAQALISTGAPQAALALLDDVRSCYPAAIRPRQLAGLALARCGDWKEAKSVLGELYELGERDAETVGIYARTWMDGYEATRDRLMLRRSRDLYAEAFAGTPGEYYPGINAAAKSVFLDETETGTRLAKEVEQLVGSSPKPGNYWHTATVAEVQLIQRNFALAALRYQQAVAMAPGAVDDHRSTCRQARRLLKHLHATPAETAAILGAFRRELDCSDADSAVAALRAHGQAVVLTFTGYSGTGYEDEQQVRDLIIEELKNFSVATTLVCAGATAQGIGMVYPIALQRGFHTAGIVSSRARTEGVDFAADCETVLVVDDDTWGGLQSNGRLSPTSRAMVDAADVVIGIGGGPIARDELVAALEAGKTVRFHAADTNHAQAIEKAAAAGSEPDFHGAAQALFPAAP